MTIHCRVSSGNGMAASIQAMQTEFAIIGMHSDNIIGFDKVGYQRKVPVVSSFAEYLGSEALSCVTDDTVGRLVPTQKPLDIALSEKGYFKVQSDEGIRLTRDGRFVIDKDGNLLTQSNEKVLANNGLPIKFPTVPNDLKNVEINKSGAIYLGDPKKMKKEYVANLGIVSADNVAITTPCVHQGYSEYSNIQMGSEFMSIMPVKRNFVANNKMFSIQSAALTKIIERLSSS